MSDGPEDRRRGHRGVHDELDPAPRQLGGQRGHVGQPQQRVGDRLHEHRAGPGPERAQDRRGVGTVHEVGLDPQPATLVGEERGGRAVEVARRDQVIAGLEEAQQERGGGAHPGRARHRGLRALEGGDQILQHRVVAGAVATVHESRLLALPHRLDGVHVLEHVHVGLVDGRGQGTAGGGHVAPAPGGQRVEVHGVSS